MKKFQSNSLKFLIIAISIFQIFNSNLFSEKNTSILKWKENSAWFNKELSTYLLHDQDIYGKKKSISKIAIFDLDHTLLDTDLLIPIEIQKETSKEIARYVDSKCIGELAKNETPDYSVFNRSNLKNSKIIDSTYKEFSKFAEDKNSIVVVLTARSDSHNFSSIREKLAEAGWEPDHIFPIHSTFFSDLLWSSKFYKEKFKKSSNPPKGFKKSWIIASLVDFYSKQGNSIKSVSYYEDTDDYFIQANALLPNLYSKIDFNFYDVFRDKHEQANEYKLKLISHSIAGKLYSDHEFFQLGKELEYSSKDCNPK